MAAFHLWPGSPENDPVQPSGHMVEKSDLEETLEKVRARVKDPRAGLFGPGSMAWRIYREMALGIGGGRALLLQTAHPYVAHAVQQHSKYQTDPHGRGRRTFSALFSWLYGDLEKAFQAARRVHAVHSKITGAIANRAGPYNKGDPYAANDANALLWVHATLWETPMQVYELLFGELGRAEKEQYYEETKLFALLFGIPEEITPPAWGDFKDYCERMFASDLLTVDEASMDVARYVLKSPAPQYDTAVEWYKIMTAGLMPQRIRNQYRFKYGRFERAVFGASIRTFRTVVPRIPPLFRQSPLYRANLHRVRGTSPSFLERRFAEAYGKLENRGMRAMAA